MIRLLSLLLLSSLWIPAWGQKVLTIIDARQPNPIAPYVYFLEDFTHKLTYEQVKAFPLDSFQTIRYKEIVQLAYRPGTVWLWFTVSNQTDTELFLISSYRKYEELDVFVEDDFGQQTHNRNGSKVPALYQQIYVNPPILPLGKHPRQVYMQINTTNSCGDYLHIGDLSQALAYQKQSTRWQSLALGAFLLVFLYAVVFFLRLRDPLVGWYALLMFTFILFYLDFYGFFNGIPNYAIWRPYAPIHFFYLLGWSFFHIRFLNLRYHSKILYWLIIASNAIFWIDFPISKTVLFLTGSPFSILYSFLHWLGIDGAGYLIIVLLELL